MKFWFVTGFFRAAVVILREFYTNQVSQQTEGTQRELYRKVKKRKPARICLGLKEHKGAIKGPNALK